MSLRQPAVFEVLVVRQKHSLMSTFVTGVLSDSSHLDLLVSYLPK